MQIISTLVKYLVGVAFFVGLFLIRLRPLSTRISRLGNNRYVQYYVQIPCQTGENRQKYQVKCLNFDNFTWFFIKNGKILLQDILP